MPSLNAKIDAYRRLTSRLSFVSGFPLVIYRALWLGLLRTEDLNELTRLSYGSDSGFQSAAHNLSGFWPWEATLVDQRLTPAARVLVAGAGGGREAIALAGLGFRVTAFDSSAELSAACRRNAQLAGVTLAVLETLPDTVPAGAGLHDAIVLGRGFYHHIPSRARRVTFLRQCRACLSAGCPLLLFDFFTRAEQSRSHALTARLANAIRRVTFSLDRVAEGDWVSAGMQHAFTRSELNTELHAGGFLLQYYESSPIEPGSSLAHAAAVAR